MKEGNVLDMSEKVLQEFDGLTNDQAYVHIFSQRMMKPVPNKPGEFYGCDQRVRMIPSILKLINKLAPHSQVFDVGAGAGDVLDFALENAAYGTVVNIEEPNPSLLQAYSKRIRNYINLKPGIAYEGTLESYYQGDKKGKYPAQPQNLILAIHMIYHLTDFTKEHVNPEADLIQAVTFLYGLLAPGGSIFIVYADLLDGPNGEADCGMAEKYFRHAFPFKNYADNLIKIYKARNSLLGPGGKIGVILKEKFPDSRPEHYAERQETHLFGKTLADISVLGLATELCPANHEKFDLSKLQFCLDYVTNHRERLGVCKEEGNVPQRGLWRVREPQILCTITKGV